MIDDLSTINKYIHTGTRNRSSCINTFSMAKTADIKYRDVGYFNLCIQTSIRLNPKLKSRVKPSLDGYYVDSYVLNYISSKVYFDKQVRMVCSYLAKQLVRNEKQHDVKEIRQVVRRSVPHVHIPCDGSKSKS